MAVGPSDTGKSLMGTMAVATFGLEEAIYVSCTSAMLETMMNTRIGFVFNDPDTSSAHDLKAFRDAINQVPHMRGCGAIWYGEESDGYNDIGHIWSRRGNYVSCTSAMLETMMNTGIGFVFNDPDTSSANDLKAFRNAINQVCVCSCIISSSKLFLFPSHIHTLRVHYAHAAANLNSGYSKYAKVARVHYFCTIALRTSSRSADASVNVA